MGQEITKPKGRPRKTEALAQAHKHAEAAQHRANGKSYRQIAEIMRVNVHTAHDYVQLAIAAVPVEAVEALRTIELARLDEALVEALRQLRMNHVMVSHGRIIEGVVDEGPKLAAIDRIIKISESRRRLLGLDLPVKVSHEVTVHDGDSDLDREIADLLAKLGAVEESPAALEAPGEAEPAHS